MNGGVQTAADAPLVEAPSAKMVRPLMNDDVSGHLAPASARHSAVAKAIIFQPPHAEIGLRGEGRGTGRTLKTEQE